MATRRPSLKTQIRKGLRFEGLEEVTGNIAKVLDSVSGSEAKDVYTGAAIIGRDSIRGLIHSVTGRLTSAIFAARGEENAPNALLGVNQKIAPHGHVVEFGHGGGSPAPPHPYFRPGIVAALSAMAERIKTGLARVLENAVKRRS